VTESRNNTQGNDDAMLSGAYALHALNDEEARRFEAHAAESEQTRNELTELADTAVLLGLAVDPIEPPPSLKLDIMAKLDETPQLPRLTEPERSTSNPSIPSNPVGPVEAKARARWFTRPVTALVGVAAAVALIVSGAVITGTINDNSFQQAQADQLAAINAAEDSQRVVAAVDGGGTATLVWSADLKSSALMVADLPALDAGQVYELWYIDESGARAAGILDLGKSGDTWRVLDGQMGAGDTVGVTVEPSGGSTTPTTDPVVLLASA
jgi:anti-sigma-K factor RskA